MFLRWILDLQKKVTINTGRDLQLKLDFVSSSDIGLLDDWIRWISLDIGKKKVDDTGFVWFCS